jgi:hypothetical protein
MAGGHSRLKRKENAMLRKTIFAPLLAASALALAVTPAYAGKTDRAREAIAAAEAKVHTAESLGAATELPREAADARAALALAKENLHAGHEEHSIRDAIHAQQLADVAIGVMQRRHDQALAAERDAHSQDVAIAQQQAAEAQARAAMAEQHAANSAAEASAARTAAMMAAQTPPAEVETTVTTGAGTARPATRAVTRERRRGAPPSRRPRRPRRRFARR